MPIGRYGSYRSDDGKSRPFSDADPRCIVAAALARSDGWVEVRPGHWAAAGRIVRQLKADDWLRTKPQRASVRRARELLSEVTEVHFPERIQ